MVVPCGKCLECLQRKRSDWTIRISHEEKICKCSAFITLTYDEFNVPVTENGNLTLKKSDLQDYFKRVLYFSKKGSRKFPDGYLKKYRKFDKPLVQFSCGEYGSHTDRPHYHSAVFNVDPDILSDCWSVYEDKKGNVQIGEVNPASIHYLTKYIVNPETYEDYLDKQKPFRLMSKGLGHGFADVIGNYCHANQSTVIARPGGNKSVLPRYLVDKIFSKGEKYSIAEKAIQEKLKQDPPDFDTQVKHREYLYLLAEKSSKSKKC